MLNTHITSSSLMEVFLAMEVNMKIFSIVIGDGMVYTMDFSKREYSTPTLA